MFDIHRVEIDWGGRKLTLETGRIARQADAAVYASYGETSVLATVVAAKAPKPGVDFFPLTVNYQEKTFAAGKIPGGFFKREGRPSEKETLTSRLIDRPVRPLFVEGFKNETQVVVTVLSHDMENDPDILALVASSAALTLSGVPFLGPIGAARVGLIGGEFVLNPLLDEMANSDLDLVIAGTHDAVMMVESEAKELSEKQMLEGVMFGHKHFQPVIQAIIKLAEKAAKEPWDIKLPDAQKYASQVKSIAEADLRKAFATKEKQKRYDLVKEAEVKLKAGIEIPDDPSEKVLLGDTIKALKSDIVRGDILKTGRRIDGRDLKTVRPIVSEVHVLPRTHGSALFTRGETQAIVVATLGTGEDEQFVDALEGTRKERFMLHYNFPPYSVGETGRMGSPGRREIGHGKLAWRAVRPVMPTQEEFPYTIRLVSEITEFERLLVDGDRVRQLAGIDGCRRPAEGAGGRHRHGPHQGRRRLRRAVGHPRRRGSPRRHGLQGGRHGEGRHFAADGHQDHRHHREDHAHCARSGSRRPAAHSWRDGEGTWHGSHRAGRARSAHRDDQDPDRQDPRSDRLRRLGDPRDRRRVRVPRSTSRTTER